MDISEYSELDEVRDAAWDAYDLDSFIAGYEDAADSDSTHEMLVGDDRADDDYIIGWHADTIKQFASECWEFARRLRLLAHPQPSWRWVLGRRLPPV